MSHSFVSSTRRWVAAIITAVFSIVSVSEAAVSGSDSAANYSPATFINNANGGTGFAPWQFNVGQGSLVGLTNSTVGGGDINSTNVLSFVFFGGTNSSYGEATRDFSSAMVQGDQFSVTMSYDWNGGNRGLDVYNASGNQLLNINYGGSDTLNLTFNGQSAVNITTNYVENTVVNVLIKQAAGNQLDVTVTRVNDGYTTNLVSTALTTPAARFKFYNGGHAGDSLNYALFVNNLTLTASTTPTLSLSGHDAMAVSMVNDLTATRGGVINTSVTVSISNSNGTVADVPATVALISGDAVTNFPITGLSLGSATIAITAPGYPTSSLDVAVYDIGYDDSSYAAGQFVTNGNSGLGFMPWLIIENSGTGAGFTNFAGTFIGDSTASGGGDVNASSGDAFGMYANQQGAVGDPIAHAIRKFDNELGVGQAVSVEIGVNYRNGSKGVLLQNSGNPIFEIGVSGDDYWYINHNDTNGAVSLGWAYAADTAIALDVKRVSSSIYDITVNRTGSAPESNALGLVDLGATPPNELRMYVYNTDGGGENNIYFNRLALYSGYELPQLSINGFDGMVVGMTNVFTITRTGPTNDPLTVDLLNFDPAIVAVTSAVVIAADSDSATFEVVGLTNGYTFISTEATGTVGYSYSIDVYDIAYDDTTYYTNIAFMNDNNGGAGFPPWILSDNTGEADGYTNFAGAFIGDAAATSFEVNSTDFNAFALYANGEGAGNPLSEAVRPFSEIGIGQSIQFDLGVNYRNGAKGVMFQNGGTWLFEVAVFADDYYYNVRDAGDNPISLGWAYAADSAIRVILSRVDATTYNVKLTRSGSSPEELLIQGITLSQAPDRVRFYVFDTDSGDENNLYFNDLAIYSGTVGEAVTDGIPNSWWEQYNIAPIDRVAANDLDGDGRSNFEEYIADTNPDNILVFFPNVVSSISGAAANLVVAGPTTNSRVYDAWWTTNLLANPVVWNRYGLNVPGSDTGTNLVLHITNATPFRIYRTGVALP